MPTTLTQKGQVALPDMAAGSYRDRIKGVVGSAEPNGMTTDEYMAWLRGEA